jgi:hypothetical protein
MADAIIGSTEYTVDDALVSLVPKLELDKFSGAITTVTTCKNAISQDFSQIHEPLTSIAQQVLDLLGEIISRIQTYQNYVDAEQADSDDLT